MTVTGSLRPVIQAAAYDDKQSAEIRLKATLALIDRAGLSPRTAVEIDVGPTPPFRQILDGLDEIESGSRAAFRASRGIEEPSATPNASAEKSTEAGQDENSGDLTGLEIVDAEFCDVGDYQADPMDQSATTSHVCQPRETI